MNYSFPTIGAPTQPLSFGASMPATNSMMPPMSGMAMNYGPAPVAPTTVVPAPPPAGVQMPSFSPVGSVGASNPLAPLGGLTQDKLDTFDARNGLGKMMWNQDGTFNFSSLGALAETLGSFGQLYSGIQANKLAKESLAFQKDAYNTNLRNQRSSYNMALEDRATARYAQNGRSDSERDSYIAKHRI